MNSNINTEEVKYLGTAKVKADTKWIYAGLTLNVIGIQTYKRHLETGRGRQFNLCLLNTDFPKTHGYTHTFIPERDLEEINLIEPALNKEEKDIEQNIEDAAINSADTFCDSESKNLLNCSEREVWKELKRQFIAGYKATNTINKELTETGSVFNQQQVSNLVSNVSKLEVINKELLEAFKEFINCNPDELTRLNNLRRKGLLIISKASQLIIHP